MKKKLAFVLGGGGSRGALQVGALHALFESQLQPDLLVGTSIGAVNSAFLALRGYSKKSLDSLTEAWRQAKKSDLLPSNFIWLAVRAMFGRSSNDPAQRLKDFFISCGLSPELRFSDLGPPDLIIISSDLNSGKPVMHGKDPDENVLDALLLSTALPPWTMPVRKKNRFLMDGGIVSNLPIEAALKAGATQIVALDLLDTRETLDVSSGVATFLDKLSIAVEKRQADLELQLAEARGIPVLYFDLVGESPHPFWDFEHTEEWFTQGYEIARQTLSGEPYTQFLAADKFSG